ncbi:unnamed protein product [Nezara viridula]|uniref:Uncharacterized protein n=1 Tax=Nezara viridula TaxID=85310 RepID=A0A9P0MN63_NEZVI|nr:unnamed protein product [Nezara viridula]
MLSKFSMSQVSFARAYFANKCDSMQSIPLLKKIANRQPTFTRRRLFRFHENDPVIPSWETLKYVVLKEIRRLDWNSVLFDMMTLQLSILVGVSLPIVIYVLSAWSLLFSLQDNLQGPLLAVSVLVLATLSYLFILQYLTLWIRGKLLQFSFG